MIIDDVTRINFSFHIADTLNHSWLGPSHLLTPEGIIWVVAAAGIEPVPLASQARALVRIHVLTFKTIAILTSAIATTTMKGTAFIAGI